MKDMTEARKLLRADNWEFVGTKSRPTDQQKNVPPPPLQQPYPPGAPLIDLIPPTKLACGTAPLNECVNKRRSLRKYAATPLSLEELSFLLWSTQGVQEVDPDGVNSLRTVPSAGARHPFETYVVVNRVEELQPGLYRYLPFDGKLCLLSDDATMIRKTAKASFEQMFVSRAAAAFIWTTVPYRTEWRYDIASPKKIALDAGHLCQNLYLASEAIDAGTCAIAAYDQKRIDKLIGVDGVDEFVIYLASVGKRKTRKKEQ
jgi:SagB-type dehydrogenase family enzyme